MPKQMSYPDDFVVLESHQHEFTIPVETVVINTIVWVRQGAGQDRQAAKTYSVKTLRCSCGAETDRN